MFFVYAVARTSEAKPQFLCAPSQKGLFALSPQRQSEMAGLPCKSNLLPAPSNNSNSPSTLMEPLFFIVICVAIVQFLRCGCQNNELSVRECA